MSKTREDISRTRRTELDATIRERRPRTELTRTRYPSFCSNEATIRPLRRRSRNLTTWSLPPTPG